MSMYLKQILEENEPSSQWKLLTWQRKNIGPALCTAQAKNGGQKVKLNVKVPAQHHRARHSRAAGTIHWGWKGAEETLRELSG